MPITKLRTYVTTQMDHFVMGLVGTCLIAVTILSGPSLRQFSSVVSVVCLMGLLWRVIGTVPRMSTLSIMLSVSLAINLATGAIAQFLLTQQISLIPATQARPDNTVGLTLVLFARLFILFVIIMWDRLLEADER